MYYLKFDLIMSQTKDSNSTVISLNHFSMLHRIKIEAIFWGNLYHSPYPVLFGPIFIYILISPILNQLRPKSDALYKMNTQIILHQYISIFILNKTISNLLRLSLVS